MSFIAMRNSAPQILTATCRSCAHEIWQPVGDDVWLCDEIPGLYCPDTGRGTPPPRHSPLPPASPRQPTPLTPASTATAASDISAPVTAATATSSVIGQPPVVSRKVRAVRRDRHVVGQSAARQGPARASKEPRTGMSLRVRGNPDQDRPLEGLRPHLIADPQSRRRAGRPVRSSFLPWHGVRLGSGWRHRAGP